MAISSPVAGPVGQKDISTNIRLSANRRLTLHCASASKLRKVPKAMGQSKGIRQVAIAILFRCQHILALPQAGVTFSAAPPVWVTVDPSGIASTIIPAVFTTQGHRTTIREPPVSLLSTGTYTISPNGRASTYTGLAPVASATSNDNDAGVFLACTANQGVNEPFCLPRSGSTLRPGHTYYSTPPFTIITIIPPMTDD